MKAAFTLVISLALAAAGMAGCSGDAPPRVAQSAARADLLAADRAFAALTRERGIETGYSRYLAADALQLPDGGVELLGKDDILANVREVTADEVFVLDWEPEDAVVSAQGDLGYTWGYYSLEIDSGDAETWYNEGKYVYVWRHTAADGWRVILDMSNQSEPAFPDELTFDLADPGVPPVDGE